MTAPRRPTQRRRRRGGKSRGVGGTIRRHMKEKKNKSGDYGLARIREIAYKGAVDKVQFKALREASGMTQAEAATKAGLTVQRWSDLENGRHKNPRILTLMKAAAVLGCKVDDLLRK